MIDIPAVSGVPAAAGPAVWGAQTAALPLGSGPPPPPQVSGVDQGALAVARAVWAAQVCLIFIIILSEEYMNKTVRVRYKRCRTLYYK